MTPRIGSRAMLHARAGDGAYFHAPLISIVEATGEPIVEAWVVIQFQKGAYHRPTLRRRSRWIMRVLRAIWRVL